MRYIKNSLFAAGVVATCIFEDAPFGWFILLVVTTSILGLLVITDPKNISKEKEEI